MFRRLSSRSRTFGVVSAVAALGLLLAACSSADADPDASGSASPSSTAELTTLRLGFFPNVTHAPAMVGLQDGLFKEALDPLGIKVAPQLFNAGPEAVTALFADSIDIAYVGPNPTINAWAQSQGDAVRVISGAASGGASLVVSKDITSPADLKGTTLATPQLGNTQDVALRYWLKQQGYTTDTEGGGDVSILPQSNSEALASFQNGDIDGAWVPEPYATLMEEAGAHVLVDERSLWPKGQFVTTDIVVRTEFLNEHPDVVKAFLDGQVASVEAIKKDPQAAQEAVNNSLTALTGSGLDPNTLANAWKQVEFTVDPLEATLKESAAHAVDVGLLDQSQLDSAGDLSGLYDLTLLNEVLTKNKLPEISS